MGKELGQELGKFGTCFEQPEEIHAARQPLHDVAQSVERPVWVSAGGDGLKQRGQHGLEGLASGRRTQRARLARSPVRDMTKRAFDIAEPKLRKLVRQD